MKTFLIVGTQRTGSSAVAEQIGLHPEVTCGWESTNRVNPTKKLRVAEQVFRGDFHALNPKERCYLETEHDGCKRAIGFRRLFRASDKWLCKPSFAPALWIDRLEAHISWLQRYQPETHIIHIVRSDNLAWLQSMGLARASGKYVGAAYPEDLTIRWPLPEAYRRVAAKHWIGRRLSTLNRSNPYIRISYESFREKNHLEVGRVLAFLGLDPDLSRPRPTIRPQNRTRGTGRLANAAEVADFLERQGLSRETLGS